MVEFTERHEKLLEETNDTVIKIKTALTGLNGSGGLIDDIKKVCTRQDELEKEHQKLRGNYKTMIGILIGSGIFTGGAVAGLTKLLGG